MEEMDVFKINDDDDEYKFKLQISLLELCQMNLYRYCHRHCDLLKVLG